MEAALREVRVALLEADVNFKVVKQLIESVKTRAMGQEVLSSLSPSQQVIGIINEELIKVLGSHESKLRFANEPPSVFLIVGLQGSGKTTSTGKLARWLTKNGHRPQLVSVDIYRPAAREQLAIIARDHQGSDLRRHAGRKSCPSIWRVRRGAKPSTTAATSCWSIPPAVSTSTIS
jgi:signal recognition particle subunit SRP54